MCARGCGCFGRCWCCDTGILLLFLFLLLSEVEFGRALGLVLRLGLRLSLSLYAVWTGGLHDKSGGGRNLDSAALVSM